MMMQSLLFNQQHQDTVHTILEKDGRVEYMPGFFNEDQSTLLFDQLLQSLDWQADQIMMFGKMITTKRKVVWVGDSDCSYTYSGVKKNPQTWTPELLQIKVSLEKLAGCVFNSCLLNLYHSGEEGMGWHSDAEKELDPKSPIASVSLGSSRKFAFRHKIDKTKANIILENGSVLMMHPPTQEYWSHSLVTTKLATPARINLTFRSIKNESSK
jgi:alkylated DNA repair dioxygenase AlkB